MQIHAMTQCGLHCIKFNNSQSLPTNIRSQNRKLKLRRVQNLPINIHIPRLRESNIVRFHGFAYVSTSKVSSFTIRNLKLKEPSIFLTTNDAINLYLALAWLKEVL